MTKATFGPGGNSNSFIREGHKSTIDAPAWVAARGLDAYEYEAGRGVNAGEEVLRKIGEQAKKHGILMSLHAPYFISLSGVEEQKRLKSIEYIEKSLWAAELLFADTIVIHCGSATKISRSEAVALAKDTLARTIDKIGNTKIHMGIETMGKVNQLGTLEEVVEICKIDKHLYPVVDFGHINARAIGGYYTDVDSYRRTFDYIATELGDETARYLHCHFSKIEYTGSGEKRHLTFEDSTFGPSFEPLAEAIVRENLAPRIICESDGTMAEDAMYMKQCVMSLSRGENI